MTAIKSNSKMKLRQDVVVNIGSKKQKREENDNKWKEKEKKNGITLVALIITIIILIILAAVTIITLANQGIIEIGIIGAEKYQEAQFVEADDIDKLTNKINEAIKGIEEANQGNLQKIGDKAELPEKWKEEPAKVEAIYIGKGEIIPVPKGFYYCRRGY